MVVVIQEWMEMQKNAVLFLYLNSFHVKVDMSLLQNIWHSYQKQNTDSDTFHYTMSVQSISKSFETLIFLCSYNYLIPFT